MSLDGLNLSALVQELNTELAGGRVDRVIQLDKFTLLFWLRLPGQTLKLLLSGNPEQTGIYLTNENFESPLQPPGFCMLLRKHLEDGRIAQIVQQELDRVVCIDIDTLGPQGMIITKRLVFEIMGKHSNIILLQDNVIIDSLRRVGLNISRFRQIVPGKTYESPPGQQKINLLTQADLTEFWQLFLAATTLTAEKALISLAFGIGPVTAKEWLWQAGLPPTIKIAELDKDDLASLQDVVTTYLAYFKTHQTMPTVCIDTCNRLLSISAVQPLKPPQVEATCKQFSTMSQAVEYTHKLRPIRILPEKDLLVRQMTAELHKLERKAEKLAEELAESLAADQLKQQGDILMANLTKIPPHSDSVTLVDFYSPQQDAQITIELNPAKTAADNAQKYYAAYHKQKRAKLLLVEQITTCQQEQAYLDTVLVSLEHVQHNSDIEEIRQELVAAKYIKPTKRRQSVPPSKPLEVSDAQGNRILIGKNNKQNDVLTFKIAHKDDLWFHTKDIPGSHVILQSSGKIDSEQIAYAAALAAYFSKARNSSKVPVDYTKRCYVKKPSGAKPGFVIYEKQTTLYVDPATEQGEKLL